MRERYPGDEIFVAGSMVEPTAVAYNAVIERGGGIHPGDRTEAQQALANAASIRSQLLGERGSLRSNQFNELASLLGLHQVQPPGLNNFFGPGQANVVDAFGLNQSAQQNAFNQRSASARAAKGEFSDLLQTIIGMGGK